MCLFISYSWLNTDLGRTYLCLVIYCEYFHIFVTGNSDPCQRANLLLCGYSSYPVLECNRILLLLYPKYVTLCLVNPSVPLCCWVRRLHNTKGWDYLRVETRQRINSLWILLEYLLGEEVAPVSFHKNLAKKGKVVKTCMNKLKISVNFVRKNLNLAVKKIDKKRTLT